MEKKEIQKLLEEGKLIIGLRETEKAIRKGEIKKVLLASNAREDVKKRYSVYEKRGLIEIEQLGFDNEELGIICKKPFNISVIGIK